MKRSIVCLILSLLLVFTAMPMTVGAAETDTAATGDLSIDFVYYPDKNFAVAYWEPVYNAVRYDIWFENSKPGTDHFAQVGSVLSQSADKGCTMTFDSSFFLDAGEGGSDYLVKIEAIDQYGQMIANGQSNTITTNIEILKTPKATFGTNGIISWNPVPNAKSYQVTIYRDSIQYHCAVITAQTSVNVSNHLTLGNRYFAFVVAVNGEDFRNSLRCQTDVVTYQGTTVVSNFVISGITEPVAGQAPDGECLIPANCGYRPTIPNYGYISWYDDDGNLLNPDTDRFKAGEKYSAQVTLIPTEGYEFAESGLTGTMNGKDTTKSIFIATAKKKIYMSRWFTCAASDDALSGTVTSFLNSTDETKITFRNLTTNATGIIRVKGNSATYSIPKMPAGQYMIYVTKPNHATRTYHIIVNAAAQTLNLKIHPLGDINGDGKITTVDYGKANSHARGKSTLSGYEFSCADVNADSKVSTADAGRINAHAKGKSKLW